MLASPTTTCLHSFECTFFPSAMVVGFWFLVFPVGGYAFSVFQSTLRLGILILFPLLVSAIWYALDAASLCFPLASFSSFAKNCWPRYTLYLLSCLTVRRLICSMISVSHPLPFCVSACMRSLWRSYLCCCSMRRPRVLSTFSFFFELRSHVRSHLAVSLPLHSFSPIQK